MIVNSWLLDKKIKRQLEQENNIVSLLEFKAELAKHYVIYMSEILQKGAGLKAVE